MKIKKYIVVLLIICMSYHNVNALCDYKEQAELNKEAAQIKAIYEVETAIEEVNDPDCEINAGCEIEYEYFEIKILNMSENFYINVSANNKNFKRLKLTYDDVKNGYISFDYEGLGDITTFTFDVYTSSETFCSDQKIRTFRLVTPRKNEYANYYSCLDYPDFYLCQKYVTYDPMDFHEFSEKLTTYEEKLEEEKHRNEKHGFFDKLFAFIDNHKLIVTIVIILLLASSGVGGYFIIKKKIRKEKDKI